MKGASRWTDASPRASPTKLRTLDVARLEGRWVIIRRAGSASGPSAAPIKHERKAREEGRRAASSGRAPQNPQCQDPRYDATRNGEGRPPRRVRRAGMLP